MGFNSGFKGLSSVTRERKEITFVILKKLCEYFYCAMPQGLAVSLSPQRPLFPLTPVHVGFVIVEVTVDRFPPLTPVFPVSSSPVYHSHSFNYYQRCGVLAIDCVHKNAHERRTS